MSSNLYADILYPISNFTHDLEVKSFEENLEAYNNKTKKQIRIIEEGTNALLKLPSQAASYLEALIKISSHNEPIENQPSNYLNMSNSNEQSLYHFLKLI